MTASEKMKEVEAWSAEQSGKLKATDSRFNHKVSIVHEDGSVFILMDAFFVERDGYVVVFSEHRNTVIFLKEELIVCQEHAKRIK